MTPHVNMTQHGLGIHDRDRRGVGTCGADDNQAQAGHLLARCLTGANGQRYDLDTETFIVEGDSAASTPDLPRLRGGCGRGGETAIALPYGVRRLVPVEGERLQGLPDNWTRVPYRNKPADKCPDGPRYKAIGNGWALPVARWVFERVAMVDAIIQEHAEVDAA